MRKETTTSDKGKSEKLKKLTPRKIKNNERRAVKKEIESKKIKKQTASATIHKESKISKQTKSRV
jgi:hypothetical protein